jgi:hypothetical protein
VEKERGGSIAGPSSLDFSSISPEENRRIAISTVCIQENLGVPRPRPRFHRSIQIDGEDIISAVIPGEEIIVTVAPHDIGVIVKFWDITNGSLISHCDLPEYGIVSPPQVLPNSLERRYIISFLVATAHRSELDQEEVQQK